MKLATQNAQAAGVGERARFEVRDIFETDLSPASVVTMYLLPDFNKKLLPRLLALRPGTRVVSHDGGIGDWPADETLEMRTPEKPVGVGGNSKIELWIVPGDVRGAWSSFLPQHGGTWRFQIAQRYQIHAAFTDAPVILGRKTGSVGRILGVGDHDINLFARHQHRQRPLQERHAWLAYDVAEKKDTHRSRWSLVIGH